MKGCIRPAVPRLLIVLLVVTLALPLTTAPGLAQAPSPADVPAPPPALSSDQAVNAFLYPEDLDPPESCHVPRLAAFGQDVELMLAPWVDPSLLLRLDQPPSWQPEAALPAAQASSDVEAIALGAETVLAAWQGGDGKIYRATWGTSAGWTSALLSDEPASGRPALLSRGPIHWAVFARFANKIRVLEWYNGDLGTWQDLPGISDAASDPVVISNDPGRMSVFYRAADGTVMFTEWEGAWLSPPVALSGPVVAAGPQGMASELSVVSRNDHHLAVVGVDADNQLWVREQTDWSEPDWSDTSWVKLMDGVQTARPAAVSRHANHVGIVVKDTAGQPHYIGWAFQSPFTTYLPLVLKGDPAAGLASAGYGLYGARPQAYFSALGWKDPVALGSASFASPMALVARAVDSLSVLGVQPDGNLYEMVWTEASGWGSWQSIAGPGLRTGQAVAAAVRRMDDILLLGRYAGTDQVWSKHYTSMHQPVTAEELSSMPVSGLPRAQALALVDGRTVWVAVNREMSTGTWQVAARDLSSGYSSYLDLTHGDSGETTDRVAVAAADLDVDGKDEVVVATLQQSLATIDISVLHLFFPTSTTLAMTTTTRDWSGLAAENDVNVAIGDLNADGVRDEVIISYLAVTETQVGIFEASTTGLVLRNSAVLPNYWDGYCGDHWSDCAVVDRDLEMAAGRMYQSYLGTPLAGDQLVLLDVSHLLGICIADPSDPNCSSTCPDPGNLECVDYAQDQVQTLSLDPLTWSLSPLAACNYLHPETNPGISSTIAADPYSSALDTGDVEADGLAEIVYSWDDRIVTVVDISGFPTPTCSFSVTAGLPDLERSLAVGDVDRDGRAEVAAGYGDSGATTVYLVEMVDEGLHASGQYATTGQRTVLVGDMDGDTRVAELAGCKVFAEVSVVAIVNGAPRWYADGEPIQDTGALFGRTYGSGGGTSDGTTTQFGASLGLGVSVEVNVPLAGVRLSEFRAAVTQEFMGSLGKTTTRVQSQTREEGYQYAGPSLGMVVYNSVEYICYYYDLYRIDAPEAKTRALACMPTGSPVSEDFKPLEDWQASSFRQSAGPSWVDVGHRTPAGLHSNDLDQPGNYGGTLPVNASQLKYTWPITAPIRISYSSQGGFENYWGISDMWGGEQEDTMGFEENTILSMGLTVGIMNVDLTGNFGLGWEHSNVTSWEQTLEMGGSVAKFMDDTRLCYTVVPFVYHARARTAAGVVYPYLEMDYYVPWRGPCALEGELEGVPAEPSGQQPE